MANCLSYIFASLLLLPTISADPPQTLPGTAPLTMEGDLSVQMVAGIDRYLMRVTEESVAKRAEYWKRDLSSPQAYEQSIQPNRERFRKYIGAVETPVAVEALELVATTSHSSVVAETPSYTVHAVRWPAFAKVEGEGLLLQPKGDVVARAVVLPDADQTPEMLAGLASGLAPEQQTARWLAERQIQVVVPVLIDRTDDWAGNPAIRMTNQPHREWVYRMAFEMGRHVIGYEVQKVLAVVDWFQHENQERDLPIGVYGYGEGGLVALYSAALSPDVDAAWISGYFRSRQRLWEEPIYRNVFSLLREFGDAEVASMVAPRSLIIEHRAFPAVDGPPPEREGRAGAAPGKIVTPPVDEVRAEVDRARELATVSTGDESFIVLANGAEAATAFVKRLGASNVSANPTQPADLRKDFDPRARLQRQLQQLVDHTQMLMRQSEHVRNAFWSKAKPTSVQEWEKACDEYRNYVWDEVIGRLPKASLPPNPRSRKIFDEPKWTGYEVVLDVWPDVYAWGYLLVPKGIKPGEKRPVVVCQHGLEGVPNDVVTTDPNDRAFGYYSGFAAKLAEEGFITFAPHNPYRGQDAFRVLQRKLNPLGKSLFSVILEQHQTILNWLKTLDSVDASRIGFYGLSYGGKTAVRVPPLLKDYALSICSADYNEWIMKNVTVSDRYSYMFTHEYEIFEFNLGHVANYAELAGLMAPRPFMVERGHTDGVAPDEWVAYEYAKVRRLYAFLGIPEKTEIEFFNGPHRINGVQTFEFLRRHLMQP